MDRYYFYANNYYFYKDNDSYIQAGVQIDNINSILNMIWITAFKKMFNRDMDDGELIMKNVFVLLSLRFVAMVEIQRQI